ncbi:MAG: hypothetical protein U0263_01730 [Polyangiaceae bacterium]
MWKTSGLVLLLAFASGCTVSVTSGPAALTPASPDFRHGSTAQAHPGEPAPPPAPVVAENPHTPAVPAPAPRTAPPAPPPPVALPPSVVAPPPPVAAAPPPAPPRPRDVSRAPIAPPPSSAGRDTPPRVTTPPPAQPATNPPKGIRQKQKKQKLGLKDIWVRPDDHLDGAEPANRAPPKRVQR